VPASSDARVNGAAPAGSEAPGAAETEVRLPEGVDLHARPAADFVRCAMSFGASIRVVAGEREADAKSLLAVLALGARGGTDLRLTAEGDDAPAALEAMAGCVNGLS
jgi:phosphotransferase system HPr (HPr) family protein